MVFQEFRLLEHLTVFDNAALAPRIAGRKPAAYRADVADLLAWVGLGERMHAMPPALSGGEKQRLAIARAVINRPDILLADEPTGNVDEAMAPADPAAVPELNRVGATVLIASHDIDLVARSGMPVLQPRGRPACAAGRASLQNRLHEPCVMSLAFDASRWWPAPLLPRRRRARLGAAVRGGGAVAPGRAGGGGGAGRPARGGRAGAPS